MEIADVFVINKADRKGVDETRRDLEQMLDLSDLADDAGGRRSSPTVALHAARASTSCGRRSTTTAPHAERAASSSAAGAAPRCARSCARSSPRRLEQRARELLHAATG